MNNRDKIEQKHLIYIFITALLFCISLNEVNKQFIKQINPENTTINTRSLVESCTIYSIDNSWYLPYIKNLTSGNGFTLDPSEPEMRVRRTPVYPLFYGSFYYLFGEKNAHFILPYFQSFLFAISAILLTLCSLNLFNNKRIAITTGYCFALFPFVPSFCYFTITEALTPFLIISSLFLFTRFIRYRNTYNLVLCGLATGICFLHRPVGGIVLIAYGLFLLFENRFQLLNPKKIKHSTILVVSFFILLLPWVVRNYNVSGELILAEKYYHGSPMNFGKAHIELRYLTSTWTNPANLSTESFSNKLISNIKEGRVEANETIINNYIEKWPSNAFQGYTREGLKDAIYELQSCFIFKNNYLINKPLTLRKDILNSDCESLAFDKIHALKNSFIAESPLRYYVLTPVKMQIELIGNSFLHHFALLNPIDSKLNTIQLLLKTIAFLLNTLLYVSLVYFVFSKAIKIELKLFFLVPVVFLLFALTAALFRYVEARYLLPVHPLLIITFSFMISDLTSKTTFFLKKAAHKS